MIRGAVHDDAENLAALMQQVERESPYMLYGADERSLSRERQSKMIDTLEKQDNSTVLVAEFNKKLVGYLFAIGGQARKNKHSAYIVIGIRSEQRGQGIGTAMFKNLEQWALNNGVHRLELTVITENIAGVKLYKKAGFETEGVKRDSLYFAGKYVDEYYMSKIVGG